MEKGKIGVTTENIFPVIKKFLYSDHEIFLRELVSNAVDATQKLKTLASAGEFKGELGELQVQVSFDSKKKTITVSDNGVGMSGEEIDKYLNQIAFSSANEFLDKYKDQASGLIGQFGLGFYSSFMVSDRVEVISKSSREDEPVVKWTCDGSPEYTLEETVRERQGTDVILHIDKDSKEFLDENRLEGLLKKYCRFLPVPVQFGNEKEWKDGKMVDTGKPKIINNTQPAWTRKPAELKDEDYNNFYRELYPMGEEPLFNIHLNVDYPFKLTGILYFPKIRNNFEIQKNKIQLYCNQVYVTDSVEGIVPEFLTLLHGVIDSPDIPLNVSRSYLQSDSSVKKISGHITKKVADRLADIFKKDRENFEKKWDDLKLFIEYGMITEEKFFEKVSKFALYKNSDGKYFTLEEYDKIISENQTDKDKSLIHLYTTDPVAQHTYVAKAAEKGYDVLVLDGQLDTHLINTLEAKDPSSKFVRVDSDVIEKLIRKDESHTSKLTQPQSDDLAKLFRSQIADSDKAHFQVRAESLDENDLPLVITQSEFMRRMKDMAQFGGGYSFYGEMPDSFDLVLNTNHPRVVALAEDLEEEHADELKKNSAGIEKTKVEIEFMEQEHSKKRPEEVPTVEKDDLERLRGELNQLEEKRKSILSGFGEEHKTVKQLIDLAMLANNMLKGEALSAFVKRSISLL
ncbi:MAG: molecular chaperone HtpG [Bacteroidales bacterium]|nr:molecular chaperone HtpG [Bacteroidales bacterium]MDT8372615.1 molecular chaperone HtpG [Bacteroidales bacterium]